MSNPIVTIEMENGGVIRAELYPEVAPNTVRNFVSLVQKGFYDGTIFHRVIPGFMIQGGDPEGTGMGGPGYEIRGEFTANGFQNDLNHTRGVLSMARTAAPDSAGSQFFIMTEDAPHLDGQYASFGMVIDGIAKDQNGKEYFMVKNSWGLSGKYKGIWYASKAFVAYKTMNILVHKDALPKDIAKKLGIK